MYELIKTLPYWFQLTLLFVPILSILFAALSILFAAYTLRLNVKQIRLNNRLCRARMVSDSLHAFMDDEMMHKTFYKIEYSKFKYGDNFRESDEERGIDKLLRHFSNLALMWQNGFLTLSDIHSVQYFILRIANNKEINNYLSYIIDDWTKKAGTGTHPYSAFKMLSNELKAKAVSNMPIKNKK
ncbi:MAG: hypothetical protein KAS23_03575 [Anaerohalosphaera sp.]|nr:hypothetical protein [Anaerohalosphaera sp.]